jgi:hypothetical protein
MNAPDITPFIDAAKDKKWLLLGALLVGAIITLAKQGWVSDWIAKKLTPTTIPYYALLVSVLATGSADIASGKTWQQAVTDSIVAAFTAIAGHQLIVESVRRGKEFIPPTDTTAERRLNSKGTP